MGVTDGEVLEAVLCFLDENSRPNLLFGAPAIPISLLRRNLHTTSTGEISADQVVRLIEPLSDTLFSEPRRPVRKVLKRNESDEEWVVFVSTGQPSVIRVSPAREESKIGERGGGGKGGGGGEATLRATAAVINSRRNWPVEVERDVSLSDTAQMYDIGRVRGHEPLRNDIALKDITSKTHHPIISQSKSRDKNSITTRQVEPDPKGVVQSSKPVASTLQPPEPPRAGRTDLISRTTKDRSLSPTPTPSRSPAPDLEIQELFPAVDLPSQGGEQKSLSRKPSFLRSLSLGSKATRKAEKTSTEEPVIPPVPTLILTDLSGSLSSSSSSNRERAPSQRQIAMLNTSEGYRMALAPPSTERRSAGSHRFTEKKNKSPNHDVDVIVGNDDTATVTQIHPSPHPSHSKSRSPSPCPSTNRPNQPPERKLLLDVDMSKTPPEPSSSIHTRRPVPTLRAIPPRRPTGHYYSPPTAPLPLLTKSKPEAKTLRLDPTLPGGEYEPLSQKMPRTALPREILNLDLGDGRSDGVRGGKKGFLRGLFGRHKVEKEDDRGGKDGEEGKEGKGRASDTLGQDGKLAEGMSRSHQELSEVSVGGGETQNDGRLRPGHLRDSSSPQEILCRSKSASALRSRENITFVDASFKRVREFDIPDEETEKVVGDIDKAKDIVEDILDELLDSSVSDDGPGKHPESDRDLRPGAAGGLVDALGTEGDAKKTIKDTDDSDRDNEDDSDGDDTDEDGHDTSSLSSSSSDPSSPTTLVTPIPTTYFGQVFEGLPFGPDVPAFQLVEWAKTRWQLLGAEMVVVLGLAYIVQVSGL